MSPETPFVVSGRLGIDFYTGVRPHFCIGHPWVERAGLDSAVHSTVLVAVAALEAFCRHRQGSGYRLSVDVVEEFALAG